MEPFRDVPDTFAVLSKNEFLQNFLAVAPLKNNSAQQKSYAINYALQGASSYINYSLRSEERRAGKGWRSRWSAKH